MYKLLSILLFAYGFAVTTKDIDDNSWVFIIGFETELNNIGFETELNNYDEEPQLTLQVRKFIDKRSGVGFGYSYYSWEAGYQEYARESGNGIYTQLFYLDKLEL